MVFMYISVCLLCFPVIAEKYSEEEGCPCILLPLSLSWGLLGGLDPPLALCSRSSDLPLVCRFPPLPPFPFLCDRIFRKLPLNIFQSVKSLIQKSVSLPCALLHSAQSCLGLSSGRPTCTASSPSPAPSPLASFPWFSFPPHLHTLCKHSSDVCPN